MDWFSLFTLIRREICLTGLSDRVGVHLSLATGGGGNVDESSNELSPLLRSSLRSLGLLLLLDLGGLRLDFTGTSQGTVDLTHLEVCRCGLEVICEDVAEGVLKEWI